MASAVEQMAANMNWGAVAKATELKKRILFVLGALIIYRIGTYIPIPGVDPQVWSEIFDQRGGGILDMFNMFSGGALSRMTIFALNIMPYISASIIMQLGSALVPQLEAIKKEGELGRTKINQYTRYLTVGFAFFQGFGEITYVKIPPGKGCGFVQFVQRHAAEMAINQMQGYPIGNSRVRLSWGRSQNNSGPAGTPYRPAPPPPQYSSMGMPPAHPYGQFQPLQVSRNPLR